MDTKHLAAQGAFKDGDEGALTATFSTFDVIDSDGDVVRPSAFKDGQSVPLVWAHDWTQPVGRGTVRVDTRGKRAIFDGSFFLNTSAGREAYETVKSMGDLQEYSWGFRITEHSFGKFGPDERDVRYIEGAEVFEVSPVLVGANRETETLAIKHQALAATLLGDDPQDRQELVARLLKALDIESLEALKALVDELDVDDDNEETEESDFDEAMIAIAEAELELAGVQDADGD